MTNLTSEVVVVENIEPREGKPNNQHEQLLAVEVGKDVNYNLLHCSSDRQTERRLLPGRRSANDWAPSMIPLLPPTVDAIHQAIQWHFCTLVDP
jgi:hypothetical protein